MIEPVSQALRPEADEVHGDSVRGGPIVRDYNGQSIVPWDNEHRLHLKFLIVNTRCRVV